MKRLVVATDIHLNFANENRIDDFVNSVVREKPDYLLLTGDLAEGRCLRSYLLILLGKCKKTLPDIKILFVLGNHDYYGFSFFEIKTQMKQLCEEYKDLIWLSDSQILSTDNQTAIIGVDGWYDGRNGDFWGSKISMSDFRMISDYIGKSKETILKIMQNKTDEDAYQLDGALQEAYRLGHRNIIVGTHVPPCEETSFYLGKPASNDGLPFFSNRSIGDVLIKFADSHKDVKIQVFAGHSHDHCRVDIRPNLNIIVGSAEYYKPRIHTSIDI